jgi:hypothetical protein
MDSHGGTETLGEEGAGRIGDAVGEGVKWLGVSVDFSFESLWRVWGFVFFRS